MANITLIKYLLTDKFVHCMSCTNIRNNYLDKTWHCEKNYKICNLKEFKQIFCEGYRTP
jgi:hypothetical protein